MKALQHDIANKKRFTHSRFSRRLTLMFIGCALIPILTLAAVAYTSVSRELVTQNHRDIGRAAKAHAISIYDRLLSLQNQLQLIGLTLRQQGGVDPAAALAPMKTTILEQFVAIDYFHGGKIRDLLDSGPAFISDAPVKAPHPSGAVALSIRKGGELAPPRVIMSLALGTGKDGEDARLEAEVQPAFLWGLGHANTLPAQTDLVVTDDDRETLINTSSLDILTLKDRMETVPHNRNQGFRYTENGVRYHVSCWPLFLTPQFGIGTWRVAYIQAEAVVLAPIYAFKRTFMLILLLTFWIVLLLSMHQIRKAAVPLRRLYTGTRHLLKGDYTHHIATDGEDEFSQVSAAFNQMADRIGHQVRGLRTMAEIGRETAAVFEEKALAKIEMRLMARHLDFARGLVLLALPDRKGLYCAGHYGFEPSQAKALDRFRLDLGPHDLDTHPDLGVWFSAERHPASGATKMPICKEFLGDLEMIWTPIVYEKARLGLLGVSPSGGDGCADEADHDLLRGIAAQTAVALHGVLAFQKLERSEGRFRDIFASAASGMGLLSPGETFTEVNQRMEKITGYSGAELRKRSLATLLAVPEDGDRLEKAFTHLRATRTNLVMEEYPLRHANGAEIWGLVSICAYYGEKEEVGHFIVQLLDITSQKQAEVERRELAKQLQQAQKMEAIGTLAGGIAHDFNNILGAIMGFAQLGGLTSKDEAATEKFAKIMTASQRAKDLVQQILTFSRRGELDRQALRIDLILKETLKLLRASIPSHIEIESYVPVIEACIMADATQMHQIIMNLCTNAYHAMEAEGGLLQVELKERTPTAGEKGLPAELAQVPCLELRVSDTGCGMDGSTLERIFDPYFTTKPQGKGTGLGLAVARGIVESYHGCIQVASTPGEGTTFRLLFPEVTADAHEEAEEMAAGTGKGERVLLVDDEAVIIEMATEMLTTLGYRVDATQDPQQALDWLRQDPQGVDLVITDLAMPHLKGDELAKALKEIRRDLPIVLCTGFNDPGQKCPEANRLFKGLLLKPFSCNALQKAIETALKA
jgi:PAS domain S-box-containing protein